MAKVYLEKQKMGWVLEKSWASIDWFIGELNSSGKCSLKDGGEDSQSMKR